MKSVDVINSEAEKLRNLGKLMKKARESELAYDTNDLEDLGEAEFSGSNLCVTYQQFQ